MAQAAFKTFPVHKWVERRLAKRKAQQTVADYIPFMSDKERQIIGYLLKYKRKSFTSAADGGHAATLLARGIVIIAARGGQHVDMEDVPMAVPEYVWEVLEKYADQFPHRPEMNGRTEVHPWRVHWMAR